MKRILILSIGLLFAGELEVDGVIKANSGIDANNNPITNVGSPLTMSDAINGNVLQDALRDDAVYEFKIFSVWIGDYLGTTYGTNANLSVYAELGGSSDTGTDWLNKLNTLAQDGYTIDRISEKEGSYYNNYFEIDGQNGHLSSAYLFILKRPISDE